MMYLTLTSPKKQTQSNPISNAHKPIKGAGGKKGIRNFFWLSTAGNLILA